MIERGGLSHTVSQSQTRSASADVRNSPTTPEIRVCCAPRSAREYPTRQENKSSQSDSSDRTGRCGQYKLSSVCAPVRTGRPNQIWGRVRHRRAYHPSAFLKAYKAQPREDAASLGIKGHNSSAFSLAVPKTSLRIVPGLGMSIWRVFAFSRATTADVLFSARAT